MAQKEVRNNVTNNTTTNKEDKKMKKDYTLNGKLTATTWQEFRAAMKEAGIDTATKTYAQLVEEYNALNVVSTGDMSSDKYYPELQDGKPLINKKQGNYIISNIVKASFIATKGDSKGSRIITMKKLFGIIRGAYAKDKDERLEDTFIKDVINELARLKYLVCKKYESGAMIFYPTKKCLEK